MLTKDILQAPKYRRNWAVIKQYGSGGEYKLTVMRSVRTRGLVGDGTPHVVAKQSEGKLSNNISRARSRVYELAACNPWEWFCTFTLDKEKYNRYDLGKFRKDFAQFVRDYRKKTGENAKYLLIPEKHEDGAWHMHGFLLGVSVNAFHAFTLKERLPKKIRKRLSAGKRVYTWTAVAERFGFTDIEPIESHEAAAKYITKYVTEDLARSVTEYGAHMYYASQSLARARVIMEGEARAEVAGYDYQNEYVRVAWSGHLQPLVGVFGALDIDEASVFLDTIADARAWVETEARVRRSLALLRDA